MYAVITKQARCPICRRNVNGTVRVNKFKFDNHSHVCPDCASLGSAAAVKRARAESAQPQVRAL